MRVDYLKVDCEGCEYESMPAIADWIRDPEKVAITTCEVHSDTLTADHPNRAKLIHEVHNDLCMRNPWGRAPNGG